MLDAWHQIVTRTPSTKTDLENEIVWNNQHTTIAVKSVFYRSWYEAGVKYIEDLISKDGKFISLNVFQRTFGIKTNFFQYVGLLNAIPMSWKKTLKASNNEEVTKNGGESLPLKSDFKRQVLLLKKSLAFMSFLFKLTSDVRLAMFQFKINHNILYTKSMLFRDRLAEDDKCYLCNLRQTLIHLFVECHYTKLFWSDFAYWWNSKNDVQISLRERDILYALKPQKRLFQGINYCLLVAKQYIYVAAKNEDPFCFSGYLAFLKNKLEIDKTQIRDLVSI